MGASLSSSSGSDQQVQDGNGQQPEADHDVHLEEGDVDPGEVVGADQGMLVDQQARRRRRRRGSRSGPSG